MQVLVRTNGYEEAATTIRSETISLMGSCGCLVCGGEVVELRGFPDKSEEGNLRISTRCVNKHYLTF